MRLAQRTAHALAVLRVPVVGGTPSGLTAGILGVPHVAVACQDEAAARRHRAQHRLHLLQPAGETGTGLDSQGAAS